MRWGPLGAAFVAGAAIGFIGNHIFSVNFKPDFDIAKILTLVVTLIIALLIQHLAYWKHHDIRAEKTLLIDQAREAISSAKELRSLAFACYMADEITEDNKKAIILLLRTLSNNVYMLEKAMDRYAIKTANKELNEIKDNRLLYKQALTGTDFDKRRYTASNHALQENIYRRLWESLHLLVFEVNRN